MRAEKSTCIQYMCSWRVARERERERERARAARGGGEIDRQTSGRVRPEQDYTYPRLPSRLKPQTLNPTKEIQVTWALFGSCSGPGCMDEDSRKT